MKLFIDEFCNAFPDVFEFANKFVNKFTTKSEKRTWLSLYWFSGKFMTK